jgi:hypothetical protein
MARRKKSMKKAPNNVNAYIKAAPREARAKLMRLCKIIN